MSLPDSVGDALVLFQVMVGLMFSFVRWFSYRWVLLMAGRSEIRIRERWTSRIDDRLR
ncbi:MAG: hypothetical protein OXF75_09180 [Acidimicrobiaceae bacterium]|nr:hypothetical protein [Acidimicrobiaceae bacterium]